MKPARARLLLLAAIAAVLLCPSQALAAKKKLQWLHFDDIRGAYELVSGYQYRGYDLFKDAKDSSHSYSALVGERIGALARGSILAPQFWSWELGGTVLFMQQKSDDTTRTVPFNSTKVEYRADTSILKSRAFPLHLFARQYTDIVRRDFVNNYDVTKTTEGVDWNWRNNLFPVRAAFSRMANDFGTGGTDFGNDTFMQGSGDVRYDGERQNATMEYRFYKYDNVKMTDLNYLSHDLALFHVLYPGDVTLRRFRIDTRLRWIRRDSDMRRDDGYFTVLGTARWLPELESRLDYQLNAKRDETTSSLQQLGRIDTRYRLYQSLFFGTMVQGGGQQVPGGSQLLGSLGEDVMYRKRLSSFAVMSHNYQFLGTRENGGLPGGTQSAVNEVQTLNGMQPTVLMHLNVSVLTVVVLSQTTNKKYRLGIDYEVGTAGDQTYIRRLVATEIPDGDSVYVNYQYTTQTSQGRTAVDHRYSARIFSSYFHNITMFAELSERWSQRRTDGEAVLHDRYETLGGGMSASVGSLSATAETRRYRTLGVTTTEYNGSLAVRGIIGPVRPSFGVRAIIQDLPTELRKNYEAFTEGNISASSPAALEWRWRVLDQESPSISNKSLDGETTLLWRMRAITLRLDYRLQMRLTPDQQYQNHRVFLSVGRPL